MIQPPNDRHQDEILNIEKMVFSQPWTRKQLKTDLTLLTSAENWVYLQCQQVAGYILGCKVMDEFHLNNIVVHVDFQGKYIGSALIEYICVCLQNQGIRWDYYTKGDHAFLYHLDLINNG